MKSKIPVVFEAYPYSEFIKYLDLIALLEFDELESDDDTIYH